MRSLFLLEIILLSVFLVSCNSHENIITNASKSNNYESINVIDPPMEKKQLLEERILEEIPHQLNGSIEDDVLKVSIIAELEADKIKYKTYVVFYNKTEKSLDLLYDCGLPISNDKFASSTSECLAVESMLLKENNKETQTFRLTKDFFDRDNNIITVKYRQDKKTKDLEIQLYAMK